MVAMVVNTATLAYALISDHSAYVYSGLQHSIVDSFAVGLIMSQLVCVFNGSRVESYIGIKTKRWLVGTSCVLIFNKVLVFEEWTNRSKLLALVVQMVLAFYLLLLFLVFAPPVAMPRREKGQNQKVTSASVHGPAGYLPLEDSKTSFSDPENPPAENPSDPKPWPGPLLIILKPYFWPTGCSNRARCLATFFFLGSSKVLSIYSPLFMAEAVNYIAIGDIHSAISKIILYCSFLFAASCLKEAQVLIYLKVKQVAYVEISCNTFAHLHGLSVDWHLRKKIGTSMRS